MSSEIRVKGIDSTVNFVSNIIEKDMEKSIRFIVDRLYENVLEGAAMHSQTGATERSLKTEVNGTEGAVIFTGVGTTVQWRGSLTNYVNFVLYGTKEHEILPKRRKVLRFVTGGKTVFAKRVKHPGYNGDDYVSEAIEKTLQLVDEL